MFDMPLVFVFCPLSKYDVLPSERKYMRCFITISLCILFVFQSKYTLQILLFSHKPFANALYVIRIGEAFAYSGKSERCASF